MMSNTALMEPSTLASGYPHISVLLEEVMAALDFQGRRVTVIDGTLGMGGHTEALLERYATMSVIGMDWDASALSIASGRLARFQNRFKAVDGSYADAPAWMREQGIERVDGILLDLGLSSKQLQDADRGFSFSKSGPLDMRMSMKTPTTAWDLLNHLSDEELADIFRTYGEERYAWRVATRLKAALQEGRLVNDAARIAEVVRAAIPGRHSGIDPATRTFQALRIAVNQELDNLDSILAALPTILNPKGRAAIISFHSLEDRKVKQAFRDAATDCVCPPQIPQCACDHRAWATLRQRKAIQPSDAEVDRNPRARSAKLRVLEML